jgi:hypothetical protein
MENFFDEEKKKKINTKKVAIVSIIAFLLLLTIILVIVYCNNASFRKWTDKNILLKEVEQGDTASIEYNGDKNSNVYAYDKYIVILENKVLKIYDTIGAEVASIKTEINNPIFDTAGKYLVVAEENGENIYLISGRKMLWSTEVEGKIIESQVNENGYVGIVISDISYKNIVDIYDLNGKSLFKTYVATNKVVDISISKNNQYLAIAEVDISGVMLQSSIRVISMEKARTDPGNSIINVYHSDVGKLIMNIEYQNKDRILCMYNDSIEIVENEKINTLKKLDNPKITFATIELKNNIATVEEKEIDKYTGMSSVLIMRIPNSKIKKYETEGIAKDIYTYENAIALNFGTDLHIINTNGWLMKKYISSQEINKIVMSNKVVGIIYRDKIEIIEL